VTIELLKAMPAKLLRLPAEGFILVLTLCLFMYSVDSSVSSLSSVDFSEKMSNHFKRAIERAQIEQEVEDHNALSKLDNTLDRRYIVMPMTDAFDPPPGTFGRGHIQLGDKVSMPKSIWKFIQKEKLEVPWQFEIEVISRDPAITDDDQLLEGEEKKADEESCLSDETENKDLPADKEKTKKKQKMPLKRVYCSILDFRSPENFIFVPDWVMKSLRLRPRDVVRMMHLVLPPGGLVKFRPHGAEFTKLANHQAVLETELKHYSALTAGTTIAFKYRDRTYKMDVEELLSDGKLVDMVCVQDCDIATDFLPPILNSETKKNKTGKKQK